MKFGDNGEKVSSLQKAMGRVGYPVVVDGQFGAATEFAVKALQEKNGLLVDGEVGHKTLVVIDRLEAAVGQSSSPVALPGGVKGLDTSHWSGQINWAAVIDQGFSFVSMKATEGLGGVDANFRDDWQAARAAGLTRCAYHFFHPDQDARTQANHFLNVMGGLYPADMAPCIDMEQMNGVTDSQALFGVLTFCAQVKAVTGKTPIFYSNSDIIGQMGSPDVLKAFPLWLAAPGHTLATVKVPKPWTSLSLLQTSFDGLIQGAKVDLDLFNGSKAQLEAFARTN